MQFPTQMALCYEERSTWVEQNPSGASDERARWLPPEEEISLAKHLVESAGIEAILLSLKDDRRELLYELSKCKNAMLWNVSDGLEGFLGSLIPAYAQLLRIPSLGSPTYTQGLGQHKHHWRAVLSAHNIYCLPGAVIRSASLQEEVKENKLAGNALEPPFFVKATSYGNNAGFIIEDPMAETLSIAFNKAANLISQGLGPILIEEYAPGDEFSVWAFELDDWRYQSFKKGIDAPYLLTELKDHQNIPVNYSLTPCELQELEQLTRRVIDILKISDYVRIEFRYNRDGKLAPIDINTGAFLVGRSFDLAAQRIAGTQETLFRQLVQESYARQKAAEYAP